MSKTIIKNAHVVCPQQGWDEVRDICIHGAVLSDDFSGQADIIDAQGHMLMSALIDTRSFKAFAPAAHAGGIARLCLMPDQKPVLDDPALVDRTRFIGGKHLPVHPLAAATVNLAGAEIAEIGLAKKNGAVAVSTGREGISSALVMHRLLTYAAGHNILVCSHAEDAELTAHASATASETATRFGLPAAPAIAEVIAVERDIRLAANAGAKLHFPQITTADALACVRAAKKQGLPITCGVTLAHVLLSDSAIGAWRTFTKFSPPLRSEDDRRAVIAALQDGTIDILSTGHDPRTAEEKRVPFAQAAPGMAAAEHFFALAAVLVHNGTLSWTQLLEKISANPARIFGLPGGSLKAGSAADVMLVNAAKPWKIDADAMRERASNTPFDGFPVEGRVEKLFVAGQQVYAA